MFRTLAPTGSPISFRQLVTCLGPVDRDFDQINTRIRQLLGVKYSYFFSTGRAAMTVLLDALSELDGSNKRKFVVIPSYTCYSVAASVIKAGLTPLICDVDPQTLSYKRHHIESADLRKVLAIVSSSLYGIPNDMEWLESVAREHATYLVDDAAQSLGATSADRPVGSFGTAGILSLDKGKVITSINGGIIVTNNDQIANQLTKTDSHIAENSKRRCRLDLLKASVYSVFLHPNAYWIPRALPLTSIGTTRYDHDFPIEKYCTRLAPIANSQLQEIEELNESRISRARAYQIQLGNLDRVESIEPTYASKAIYLRYPIRITSPNARVEVLRSLSRFGATGSYPRSIAEVPEIQSLVSIQNDEYSGGKSVAGDIVTLPTHSYVTFRDIESISGKIRSILSTVR